MDMVVNSVADAVKSGYHIPLIEASGGLTHKHREYIRGTIDTIHDMISSAKHSIFMFLGDGEYLSNNLTNSLKVMPELDVTLVFGPYLNASPRTIKDGQYFMHFGLIDDLHSDKIKRYMRNTRTYDQNLVIADNGVFSYTFPSSYSKTQPFESGPLEHSRTILTESVPIIKGEVEPVRLSDGDIEDLINSHPRLNEFTREKIEEIVERERMKRRLKPNQALTPAVLS